MLASGAGQAHRPGVASAVRARARASLGVIELLLSRNDLLPGDGVRAREPSASCPVPEEHNTWLCTLASSRRLPVSTQTPSSAGGQIQPRVMSRCLLPPSLWPHIKYVE